MTGQNFVRCTFGVAASVAFVASCSGNGSTPLGDSSVAPTSKHAMPAIPMAQHAIAHSWMHKPPKGTTGTLWASDVEYASVDVVAYPSGTLMGQVAGFYFPQGDCSDKHGNVYVVDLSLEEGFEIAAGTSKVINSWPTGGEPYGCSVNNNGDVAFTNFYPIEVVVFPGGGPTGVTYPAPGGNLGIAGYDPHGNLFAVCYDGSQCTQNIAELRAGSSSWTLLNVKGTLLDGTVQNMGKYLGIGGGTASAAGAIELVRISSSKATVVKTRVYHGSGCSNYLNFQNSWASITNKPNGVVTKNVKDVAMGNDDCFGTPIDVFKAKGGTPIDDFLPLVYQYDDGLTFTKP